MHYHAVNRKRKWVGVITKEEYANNVVEVKRVSDRVMSVTLAEAEKSIPWEEREVIGTDLNRHDLNKYNIQFLKDDFIFQG